ncbi:hypothetical protein N0V82_006699 [Gnomoniopsis sp. IMI 355080]|nr:hypothetical protein N0V82_006699 [Gnomoniopsis sp. IMI 355080]
MGSTDKSQEEFIVLVTGFGPFKNDFPRNPSWDIASTLPSYLPILNAKSSTSVRDASIALPPVRILVHPEPIRVTYATVRELVPKLWNPEFSGVPRIDFVLHIGMASTQPKYSLEQLGHRDDYKIRDLDGAVPVQDQDSPDWPWLNVPSQLTTGLDVGDVHQRWTKHLPHNEIPLLVSTNAGHFLCDYIYFNSLAQCFKANETRRVAFLHVPAAKAAPEDHYEEHIKVGREVATQLIRSIVESELSRSGLTA